MHGPLNRGQGHLQGLLQQCHQTSPQVNHEMLTPTFFNIVDIILQSPLQLSLVKLKSLAKFSVQS